MNRLDMLEQKSIYITREAYSRNKHSALLWSTGKDSTVMLWIARKAFFGKIPFPVIHIDTSYYPQEVYTFREKYEREWGLHLIIAKNEKALEHGMEPGWDKKSECCDALKTIALKNTVAEHSLHALFIGIRGDENGILAKGNSYTQQSPDLFYGSQDVRASLLDIHQSEIKTEEHYRIHPIIFWTVYDIWQYIKRENIPVLDLYFAHGGKRCKSIGCESCCRQVDSTVTSIKGIIRELEKEQLSRKKGRTGESEDAYTIQKLKSLGYM